MQQSLPCPHCAQPVGLEFHDVVVGGFAFHGLCPACVQPYRLAGRVRLAAFASMLGFGALGAALAFVFGHCAACVRAGDTPALAWLPVLAVVGWLAGAVAAGALGAWLHVARARGAAARPVLVAVDAADVATTVDNLRAQPRTAIAAAIALLSLLLFMLADEWRAIAARFEAARMPLRADPQLGVASAGADATTFWFFVAVEIALTAIVLACLVALLRRTLKERRARATAGAAPQD